LALAAPEPEEMFRPDRILIKPAEGAMLAGLVEFHAATGARVLDQFEWLEDIQVLELPAAADVVEWVRLYRGSGWVEFAEPDYFLQPASVPDDAHYLSGDLWHLHNTGQNGGTAGADIGALEAWQTLTDAGDIVVAVVDTGVRYTHEDLAANLWINPGEIAGNGLDDDGNGYADDIHGMNAATGSGDPVDLIGHGTQVAGLLGAVGNNALGVTGVAWRIQIMACRFFDDSGNGSVSDAVQAIDYARRNGAHLINMSVGSSNYSSTLERAISNCQSSDIIVVAAAGNDGLDRDVHPFYPASFSLDNIVSVAATTRNDHLASYSGYGATTVDLGAPGSDLYTTRRSSDTAYGANSGSSFAAPMVSGALALLKARNPSLGYGQLIQLLLNTVDPLTGLAGKCVTGGRLNLAAALAASPPPGYSIRAAAYDWIDPTSMPALSLGNSDVSPAQALPFAFRFYGVDYTELYVGANGLIGFENDNLSTSANTDLPDAGAPNNIICPFWDSLNPAAGGSVRIGTLGSAPHRQTVISWVNVPHAAQPPAHYTFQVILEEGSHRIRFQYHSVAPGRGPGDQGKSATVGLENASGTVAAKYSYNGSTLLADKTALMFAPPPTVPATTVLTLTRSGPPSDGYQLLLQGEPLAPHILEVSTNLVDWIAIWTNSTGTDGTLTYQDPDSRQAPTRHYRVRSQP
jgi:subtilisin family serine protease